VFNIGKHYCEEHKINVTDEQLRTDIKEMFNSVDINGDGNISRSELLGALFSRMDRDKNGSLKKGEFKHMVKAYAKFLKVDLKDGWKKEVNKWYKDIDQGITLEQLHQFLEKKGETIHGLKGAVKSLAAK